MPRTACRTLFLIATILAVAAGTAGAGELTVGINLPQTGPGSSFGVPMINAVSLMPSTIGGLGYPGPSTWSIR